jgi:hypothetical protein
MTSSFRAAVDTRRRRLRCRLKNVSKSSVGSDVVDGAAMCLMTL